MTADPFIRNVMISGVGHVAVALLIFFRAISMPSEHIEIRNAIRVDVVGLPQKLQELPSQAVEKPAPAPKALPKKADSVPVVKTKAKEAPKKKEIDHSKAQRD